MLFVLDPFTNPEKVDDVQKSIDILEYRLRVFNALEHTKTRLSKAILESNTLAKCGVFIRHFNAAHPASNFRSEVAKLNRNELMYALISFEDRRLKKILDLFQASDIKKYIEKQDITCVHRSEISTRVKYILAGCEGSPFSDIYEAACAVDSDAAMDEEPEPETAAKEENAFKLLGVRRESLKNVFLEHIAKNTHLTTVEARYPRGKNGDAFLSLDIESDRGPVATVLDEWIDRDIPVAAIPEVFGSAVAEFVDKCDLREWEKRHGLMERTNCVKMKMMYHVDIRMSDDFSIAKSLYS